MVELFEEDGVRGARRYLDHLKMEYAFWMDGAESLIPNQAYRHVDTGRSLLNRFAAVPTPHVTNRWLEDVETAKTSGRPPNEVYRDFSHGSGLRLGLLFPVGCVILVVWRAFVPPSSSPSI